MPNKLPHYTLIVKSAYQSHGTPVNNIIDVGKRVLIFTTGNLTFYRNTSDMRYKIYGLPIYAIDFSDT